MANNLAFIKFFPNDWLSDGVAACSLAAQGLWLRMMILMHHSKPYGYLGSHGVPIAPETIALRCGCSLEDYTTVLAELDRAGVPRRTPAGVIYSKRMVEDFRSYKRNAANGLKGFEIKQQRNQKNGGLKPPLKPPSDSASDSEISGNGGPGERGSGNGRHATATDLMRLGAEVKARMRRTQ